MAGDQKQDRDQDGASRRRLLQTGGIGLAGLLVSRIAGADSSDRADRGEDEGQDQRMPEEDHPRKRRQWAPSWLQVHESRVIETEDGLRFRTPATVRPAIDHREWATLPDTAGEFEFDIEGIPDDAELVPREGLLQPVMAINRELCHGDLRIAAHTEEGHPVLERTGENA
jgi:hypothetical protein